MPQEVAYGIVGKIESLLPSSLEKAQGSHGRRSPEESHADANSFLDGWILPKFREEVSRATPLLLRGHPEGLIEIEGVVPAESFAGIHVLVPKGEDLQEKDGERVREVDLCLPLLRAQDKGPQILADRDGFGSGVGMTGRKPISSRTCLRALMQLDSAITSPARNRSRSCVARIGRIGRRVWTLVS